MRIRSVLLAGVLVACLGIHGAHAQGAVVGSAGDIDVSVVRAKVTRIDPKNRALTVRGPAGNLFQVTAGPDVRNFAQIKTGDDVVLSYTQAIAVVITKPGPSCPMSRLPMSAGGQRRGRSRPAPLDVRSPSPA